MRHLAVLPWVTTFLVVPVYLSSPPDMDVSPRLLYMCFVGTSRPHCPYSIWLGAIRYSWSETHLEFTGGSLVHWKESCTFLFQNPLEP